jgi:hypothetical protein
MSLKNMFLKRNAPEPLSLHALAGKEPLLGADAQDYARMREDLKSGGSIFFSQHPRIFFKFRKTTRVVRVLTELLGDDDATVLMGSADALRNAAAHNLNISAAVPALISCLGHENMFVRRNSVRALGEAAVSGVDIRAAIPKMMALLDDPEKDVRLESANALRWSTLHGVDLHAQFSAIMMVIFNGEAFMTEHLSECLKHAAARAKYPSVEELAIKANELAMSQKFVFGARQNSDWYVNVSKAFAEVTAAVGARMQELEEAA